MDGQVRACQLTTSVGSKLGKLLACVIYLVDDTLLVDNQCLAGLVSLSASDSFSAQIDSQAGPR